MRRILWVFVALPVGAVLVALAVANGHEVRLVLDPFRPEHPALFLELPFYLYLFAAVLVGIVLGGACMWLGQSHWRRTARRRGADAVRWQAEADRLARERDRQVGSRQLVAADR